MGRRKKRGNLVVGACPVPDFEGVAWPEDIQWDTSPTTPDAPIAAEVIRGLAQHLPASFVAVLNQRHGQSDWRTIAEARRDAGLPPDWDAVLAGGKAPAPDADVGRAVGRTAHAVREARHNRRIPCCVDSTHRPLPDPDVSLISRLGREPDAVIAADTGRSRSHIQCLRRRLGIPASRSYTRREVLKRKSPADGA